MSGICRSDKVLIVAFVHLIAIIFSPCVCVAENGPFKINQDLTLRESDYGWDKGHNMIYVDQPIGTGFSYSNSPKDTVYNEHGLLQVPQHVDCSAH
jgi:hypothetical protein